MLAIDLGNSSTRIKDVKGVCGWQENGQPTLYKELPNCIYLDYMPMSLLDAVSQEIDDNLDLTITKLNATEEDVVFNRENTVRCLIGSLARQHSSNVIVPNSMTTKANQKTTYINTLGMIFLYLATAKNFNPSDLKVGILLPPGEIYSKSREKFLQNLFGDYQVVNNRTKQKFEFTLSADNVIIQPEGVAALASLFIMEDENGNLVPNPEYSKYNGKILGIDIGAGSSDVCVLQNKTLITNSIDTIRVGMNTVDTTLKTLIAKEFNGYKPTPQVLREATIKGKISIGEKEYDITKLVRAAKKEVRNRFLANFTEYTTEKDMPPEEFELAVGIGGGSVRTNTESLTEMILDELNATYENIKYVIHPAPRRANLDGLAIKMKSKFN